MHFMPKPLPGHPVSTIQITSTSFYNLHCDTENKTCAPYDSDVLKQGKHVWEYVEKCTPAFQPCIDDMSPTFVLRKCPPGTELVNATANNVFDAELQECRPCPNGFYILDPSRFQLCCSIFSCLNHNTDDYNTTTKYNDTNHLLSPIFLRPACTIIRISRILIIMLILL